MPSTVILPLDAEQATLALAGGKGANLARLARDGLPVPGGFVVTTDAYHAFVEANALADWLPATARAAGQENLDALEAAARTIRARFAAGTLPPDLALAVCDAYAALGRPPVAVRSSATAEDLPDLSFAGQQDTYLNVQGDDALLASVIQCWSSLWTARAIGYRGRNRIPDRDLALAVVVQRMVPSEASGVLFTANPLTGTRTESVIDATLGLGEALVSGRVEPDHYVIDTGAGRILSRALGAKALSIRGREGGGTITQAEDAGRQQALPDEQILALAALGRRVADLLGEPQDIEWGWANGSLALLQSRPITSLYPVPAGMSAEPLQALLSFGAVQGMLAPITPLGRDFFASLFASISTGMGAPRTTETQGTLHAAGERLWVNVTGAIRHGTGRRAMRAAIDYVEPGSQAAVTKLMADPRLAVENRRMRLITRLRLLRFLAPAVYSVVYDLVAPAAGRARLDHAAGKAIERARTDSGRAGTLRERIAAVAGVAYWGPRQLLAVLVPAVVAGQAALQSLMRLAGEVPGGEDLVLAATRGLPHNVTTEMDLALWAAAREIKADPSAAEHFGQADAEVLVAEYRAGVLPATAQRVVAEFLRAYGVRGVGEIDLARPRWNDDPLQIIQVLGSYLQIDAAHAPDVVFARGAAAAEQALQELFVMLGRRPHGKIKVRLARFLAGRMRELAGLRESPKLVIVRLTSIVRETLLAAGRNLVASGALAAPEDVFFLHMRELQQLAAGETGDRRPLVGVRRRLFEREALRRQIPRILLSDGTAFYEGYVAPAGPGVITGAPVSPGTVEGMVRIVLDPHGAQLRPGEILVCPGTDPAWTPLFLAAGGLIMEVGGMMTHGSVVAREYGIPAVVGVNRATTRLRTGMQVRVNGSRGEIVILSENSTTPP